MYGIIMCTEAWTGATAQPEEVTRLGGGSYYLDAALASMAEFRTTCPLLPRSAASQHGQPVVRDVPVLVLVGDIDPQNPLPNMQGVTDWYPQAQIVIEPGQGHATLNTRCRTDLVNNFAIDPAKPLDTSCLETGLLLFARP
jgi:pimeloyl-ACP methyl ester carboxylesterase